MRNPVQRPSNDSSPSFFPSTSLSSDTSLVDIENLTFDNEAVLDTVGGRNTPLTTINDSNEKHEIYLYLIRHGEAEHNIQEERAMEEAKVACLLEGLSEDDVETQRRMECARKAVLNDTSLKDATLSPRGRKEAEQAREKLHEMVTESCFPMPNYIFVSPLTRTLETADIIFPGHADIHVRDALSERRTGKPPDTRSSVAALIQRPEFHHFSMQQLLSQSMSERGDLLMNADKEVLPNIGSDGAQQFFIMGAHDTWERFEKRNYEFYEEDREELRKRTEYLSKLLTETTSQSIACVTHKGYLRELERGPFGQDEAPLFKNCEIRVYRLTLSHTTGTLLKAQRVR